MDLRSIINSDSSNNTNSSRPPSKLESPAKPTYPQFPQQSPYQSPSSLYQGPGPHAGPNARPSQPPPLRPPPHRDLQSPSDSNSHTSAQSPYQYTPTSSLNGNQYPFPQNPSRSPANASTGLPGPMGTQYSQRERTTTVIAPGSHSYGQPSPSPYTPSTNTPGSAHNYTQYPRPQSSHSSTPVSAQSHVQSFPRESPYSTYPPIHPQFQPIGSQQYQSQPGTPLGPPPTLGRTTTSLNRETSGNHVYDRQRSHSGSSYSNAQVLVPSPMNDPLGPIAASPTTYEPRQPPLNGRGFVSDQDRERSISVSPKTRLPSQPKTDIVGTSQDSSRSWSGRVTPTKRKAEESHPDEPPPQKISPNTRLPSQPKVDIVGTSRESSSSRSGQVTPTKRKAEEIHPDEPPARKFHNQTQTHEPKQTVNSNKNGDVNAPRSSEHNLSFKDTVAGQVPQHNHTASPTLTFVSAPTHLGKEFDRSTSQGIPCSIPSSVASSRPPPTTPQPPSNHHTPLTQASSTPFSSQSAASAHQLLAPQNVPIEPSPEPKKKRMFKKGEIPIWAMKYDRKGNGDGIPLPPKGNKNGVTIFTKIGNQYIAKAPNTIMRDSTPKHDTVNMKNNVAHENHQSTVRDEPNGHPLPGFDIALPRGQPPEFEDGRGPLGPWEPTIINLFPHEEISRVISDFLFQEVVNREDVGAGPAGGGPGQGAVLEIEAKIGQLIDKNTNDRLRLPVMTECVISKSDPNLRVNFKSSMTEAQHRTLNNFLNKAYAETISPPSSTNPPAKRRIPMSYVHTRESDTFYELSQSGQLSLPASIRTQLNPRHNKAKVRITTNQKTGEVIAKIIKARVADIDIYSPRTAFDWRVSVNLEMNFDGDMRDLVEVQEGQKRADRNKDRMSYRHLAYQIDLTQVTPAEATSKADKEHELEIEVSSAEVRRQGLLARGGQTSQYEELIRGFVDNVRVLARHCQ